MKCVYCTNCTIRVQLSPILEDTRGDFPALGKEDGGEQGGNDGSWSAASSRLEEQSLRVHGHRTGDTRSQAWVAEISIHPP